MTTGPLTKAILTVRAIKTKAVPIIYQKNCDNPTTTSPAAIDPPTTTRKIGSVQLKELAPKATPKRKNPLMLMVRKNGIMTQTTIANNHQ